MPSRISWKLAPRPNYTTNVDKTFPYSEVPFVGEYHLVRLPAEVDDLIEHIDYWGEGRIVTEAGISGFVDSYNVNHEYQLVSNGPDTDKKIPNRIPVISYTNCDTSGYIRGNSVKFVTIMGAPINKSCAEDVVRIVSDRCGKIVVFDIQEDSAYIKNLEKALENKTFIYCPDYVLPTHLQGLTLFNTYRAYLNAEDTKNELYSQVAGQRYDAAVALTTRMISSGNGSLVKETVTDLLTRGMKYVVEYGYKLWTSAAKDVVIQHFPEPFKLIYNQDQVKIIDKKFTLALKLDANVDDINDRHVWGDSHDKTSKRVSWKFIPIWDQEVLYFKIMDIDRGMYLKMGVHPDNIGDRKAWASNDSDTTRHQWILEPVKINGEVLFYIINRGYGQGLKLAVQPDSYNDRRLWGNQDSVVGNPNRFGWYIEPWN